VTPVEGSLEIGDRVVVGIQASRDARDDEGDDEGDDEEDAEEPAEDAEG